MYQVASQNIFAMATGSEDVGYKKPKQEKERKSSLKVPNKITVISFL